MAKKRLEPRPFMYPKPAILVGALVRGMPNFMTIANCGIVNYDPPMISIAAAKHHYTNRGIRNKKTFSVNIPSAKMAKATDYCGLYSGRREDKSGVFEVFYGKLKTAPMIEECPVNLECELAKTIHFEDEDLFIGEIKAIYVNNECMTQGSPDIKKVDPLIYSTSDRKYYRIGKEVGRAYSIGKKKK